MIVDHTVTSEGLQANPVAGALTPGRARETIDRAARAADE
jgi:hypothetical protein